MLGHRPALILGAEPVRLRDADVVEEDLVQLMVAGEGADRLDADARRGHVEQQETDPRLWLALGRGTDEAEHAVGEMGVGRSEEHPSELQSLMRISYAVF